METGQELEQILDVELLTVLLASATVVLSGITYTSAVKYFRDVNLLLPNDALCCYNGTESSIIM